MTIAVSAFGVSRILFQEERKGWALEAVTKVYITTYLRNLRSVYFSETDFSRLRTEFVEPHFIETDYSIETGTYSTNTPLQRSTTMEPRVLASTTSNSRQGSKSSLPPQWFALRTSCNTVNFRPISALSVKTLGTLSRYSLFCMFTLPCWDNSSFLIALWSFEPFSFYFSHYITRTYCQVERKAQAAKFSTHWHYSKRMQLPG